MRWKINGNVAGVSFAGELIKMRQPDRTLNPLSMQCSPFLSLYAHSDEVEELAVISLPPGIKVETDPNWESMTGVSA
jgi:hypothetical protein